MVIGVARLRPVVSTRSGRVGKLAAGLSPAGRVAIMKLGLRVAGTAIGWLAFGLAVPPALSQDADPYAASFDPEQPIRIEGQVKDVQWTNPRAWLVVISAQADWSGPAEFSVMLPAVAVLERCGWTRERLRAGDTVVIDGHRSRDGMLRAVARRVVAADGETLLDLDTQPLQYSRSGAELIQGAR